MFSRGEKVVWGYSVTDVDGLMEGGFGEFGWDTFTCVTSRGKVVYEFCERGLRKVSL